MPAEFEPTTDQRALVQNAAAFGINQADIANQLNIAKYYTARRMGWKETNVSEHVGKDGGPIENKDVTAPELLESRIAWDRCPKSRG